MTAQVRPPGRDFIDTERAVSILGERVEDNERTQAIHRAQLEKRSRTDRIMLWATFCSSLALGAVVLFAANQDSEGIATQTVDAGLLAATQQQSSDLRTRLNQTNERLVQLGIPPIATSPDASPNQLLLDTIIATARVDQAEGRAANGGVETPLTLNDLPVLAQEATAPEPTTDSANSAPAAQPTETQPTEPAQPAQPAEQEPAPDPAPADQPAQDPEPTTSEPPQSEEPAQEEQPAQEQTSDPEPKNDEPLVSVNLDEAPIIGGLL